MLDGGFYALLQRIPKKSDGGLEVIGVTNDLKVRLAGACSTSSQVDLTKFHETQLSRTESHPRAQ